ncbi:MAG: hypothetical protein M1334_02550, partial [Patescibacteria group bacterium]|nr:hypothetical protein [Patescibacteria group bacterium]
IFAKLRNKIETRRAGTISEESLMASLQSCLGVMSHANAVQLTKEMKILSGLSINKAISGSYFFDISKFERLFY